jgi:hypothetical protein
LARITRVDICKEWLTGFLTRYGNPLSSEVYAVAEAEGFPRSTLQKAARQLDVTHTNQRGWPIVTRWSLPK